MWSPDGARDLRRDRPAARQRPRGRDRGPRLVDEPGSGHGRSRTTGDAALLTADRVGRGEIFFLADASPLENAYLARADNAAFALGLAGDATAAGRVRRRRARLRRDAAGSARSRRRGRSRSRVLAVAAVVLAWSRSRRFGPPDRPARELPPAARRVRARARRLARAHSRSRARARADATVGRDRASRGARTCRPDASPEEIDRAAIALGYSEVGTRRDLAPADRRRRRARAGPAGLALVATRWENDVNELRDRVVREVRKVVVGQDGVVEVLLASVTVGGHLLLEGVPGVAKTLLANAFARAIGVEFRRVQFTPDMLPSDLTGTMTLRVGRARVPARSGVHQPAARRRDQPDAAEDAGRAARGDAGAPGERRRASRARSPIRSSSSRRRTRSSTKARTRCPRRSSTASSPRSTSATRAPTTKPRCSGSRTTASRRRRSTDVQAVTSPAELIEARAVVDATTVSDAIVGYVVALVRRTRELPSVSLGASPRGAVHLLAAAKAVGPARGPRLRDARRRRRGRARGAPPPAPAPARGRARALHRRRRGRDRDLDRSRARDEPREPGAAGRDRAR